MKKSTFDEQPPKCGLIIEDRVGRESRTMKETSVPSELTALTSARIQEKVKDDHWAKILSIALAKERRKYVSIVVRQNGEERMIDLKSVMVWLMFSMSELLIVMRMEVLLVLEDEVCVRREVTSESSESSMSGSIEE